MTVARLPTVYIPHGGGPWPYVDLGFPSHETASLAAYLATLPSLAGRRDQLRSILVVSAHWEAEVATVSSSERPEMLYDYYGFPPAAYQVKWPAPGSPSLAQRVRTLLSSAGIANGQDDRRGFDHATFVPLGVAFPHADIPTVQLSLKASLDPAEHFAIGAALTSLRDEGVLIVGSGLSFHNMRGFGNPRAVAAGADQFDQWLRATCALAPDERNRALLQWSSAPAARLAHPREEHLLPLMVVAGVAANEAARIPFRGAMFGLPVCAVQYG